MIASIVDSGALQMAINALHRSGKSQIADALAESAVRTDLASEVRRLREENERLRIENIALRADADRIDWLADAKNTVGSVVLPRNIVDQNISSMRQAIDAARGAKPEPAP